MAKKKPTEKTVTDIEYIPMEEAKIHRKYKSKVVDEAIAQIIARDGAVSGASLLSEATAVGHPLHDYFDWDDSTAGHKYRIAQARCLILASRFVAQQKGIDKGAKSHDAIEEGRKAVRVRRLLPFAQKAGFGERPRVLSDDESRKAIIERKIGVLRSWCQSVVDIEELAVIRSALLDLIAT